jgi:threonylcarbamoyladenosine tRNA methylthiotransferase MtaB
VKYDPLLINETKKVCYSHLNSSGLMEVSESEQEVLVH